MTVAAALPEAPAPEPAHASPTGWRAPSARVVSVLLGALSLALWPLAAGSYGLDLATKTMIYAIVVLSLQLLVGTAGLVCFGQAAFFGVAAYATVRLTPADGAASIAWLLPAAVALAAVVALVIGALSLRTRGVYFIMVTLAFAQMAYHVAHDTPLGGGSDGIYLAAVPVAALGQALRVDALDLGKPLPMYYFVLACLALSFVVLALLARSRFGRALAGMRINEARMRAAGFSPYPYQLAAFVVSGAIAGLGGFLFAVKDGFVNPELLSWHLSGAVLIMLILGGIGHLRGAVLGAFAFTLLQELFRSEAVFGAFAKHWLLGLGLTIIACVALLPRGLVGAGERIGALMRRRAPGARVRRPSGGASS